MSRLSESRISHLAHLVVNGLKRDDMAEFPNEGLVLSETKRVLHEFFEREDQFEELVRQKIRSLSRYIPPGSREWDVLYRKYLEEEMRRQKNK
jgi:uncharacterized protein